MGNNPTSNQNLIEKFEEQDKIVSRCAERLTDLPMLENGDHIESLYCDINALASLPDTLATRYPNLTELSACGNALTSLPTLPSSLSILRLGCNQLSLMSSARSPSSSSQNQPSSSTTLS